MHCRQFHKPRLSRQSDSLSKKCCRCSQLSASHIFCLKTLNLPRLHELFKCRVTPA